MKTIEKFCFDGDIVLGRGLVKKKVGWTMNTKDRVITL